MQPEDTDITPIPPAKVRSHERRIQELEVEFGRLLGGFGDLDKRINKIEMPPYRDEIPSETKISISPSKARLNFRNVNTTVILIVAVAVVTIVWLITK